MKLICAFLAAPFTWAGYALLACLIVVSAVVVAVGVAWFLLAGLLLSVASKIKGKEVAG